MSDDVQLRVLLSAILFRATMRAFARTLSGNGLGPPSPEEKMRLHQVVEERAWALPAETAALAEGREVDEGVEGLAPLEAEVRAIVEEALAIRGGK